MMAESSTIESLVSMYWRSFSIFFRDSSKWKACSLRSKFVLSTCFWSLSFIDLREESKERLIVRSFSLINASKFFICYKWKEKREDKEWRSDWMLDAIESTAPTNAVIDFTKHTGMLYQVSGFIEQSCSAVYTAMSGLFSKSSLSNLRLSILKLTIPKGSSSSSAIALLNFFSIT